MNPTRHAAVLVAGLLLTACGGDEPSRTDQSREAGVARSAAPEAEPLTQSELQAALVTLEDLPTGYSPDKVTENDDDSEFRATNSECQARYDLLEDFGDDAAAEAKVAFAKEPASSLEQSWGTYETSPEELSARFELLESLVTDCAEGQLVSTDGTPALKLTLEPIPFPDLGDDSFGMNAELSADGLTLELAFGFVRVGNSIQAVFQGGLGRSDPELVAEVARLGVERLPKG